MLLPNLLQNKIEKIYLKKYNTTQQFHRYIACHQHIKKTTIRMQRNNRQKTLILPPKKGKGKKNN
jgi:hypothetical protein